MSSQTLLQILKGDEADAIYRISIIEQDLEDVNKLDDESFILIGNQLKEYETHLKNIQENIKKIMEAIK